MVSDWFVENAFIENKIKEAINNINTLFVKVVETDGYYVNVLPFTVEEGFTQLNNIPILQTQYFSPIVQENDTGVLMNINLDLSQMLNDNSDVEITRQNYYIFFPLCLNTLFKGNPNIFQIKSPDLASGVSITNGSVSIASSQNLSLNGENVTLSATQTNFTLGSANANADSLSLESSGDLSIKGGGSPIEVGNGSGTLGDVVDSLVDMMDALASGMTGASTNPAGYKGAKSALVAKIKEIVK